MYKKNFISEEINEFKKFIIKFNIVGLALGTVIGFSLSNSTEILKDVKDKNDTKIILQKKILIELQKLNNK